MDKIGIVSIWEVRTGKFKGQWRFTVFGNNNEPVAKSTESYTTVQMCEKTVKKFFPESLYLHESWK